MTRTSLAALVLASALLAIYLPSVGAGFIRDDFAWIRSSAVGGPDDLLHLLQRNTGFYRPAVGLSFAVNRVAGLNPLAYSAVNLALLFACVALFFSLLTRIGIDRGAALFGAGLWALNFHGINMAVLWISGRTALLLVFFALLAARAVVRDAWGSAAAWTFLALMSKEEAVMLPVILIVWRRILDIRERRMTSADAVSLCGSTGRSGSRVNLSRRARQVVAMAVPLVAYFTLRIHSGAMTPFDAPAEYRFTIDASRLARNVLEYADRAATLPALVIIAALAFAMAGQRRPLRSVDVGSADGVSQSEGLALVTALREDQQARALIVMGAAWLIGGYAVTMWLPVRSSLYACFPSIGAVIIATVVCRHAFARMSPRRRSLAVAAALAAPFVFWPVYRARNDSYDAAGALSRSVLGELRAVNPPAGAVVVITDDNARPNLASTFGGLMPDALALYGLPFTVCIEPYSACTALAGGVHPVRLVLERGHLKGR